MLLVEAGLEEVVSLVASHLDSLQVGAGEGKERGEEGEGTTVCSTCCPALPPLPATLASPDLYLCQHTPSTTHLVPLSPSRSPPPLPFPPPSRHPSPCHPPPQVSTRLKVLQRMWGLIALLQSPTDRMTALAAVWRTALDLHMASAQARTQGGGGGWVGGWLGVQVCGWVVGCGGVGGWVCECVRVCGCVWVCGCVGVGGGGAGEVKRG
jgi:hypothetical protein